MNAEDLYPDTAYKLKVSCDGHPPGTLVIFKWMTSDERLAVVHPNGEPDMQSMFTVYPHELEEC